MSNPQMFYYGHMKNKDFEFITDDFLKSVKEYNKALDGIKSYDETWAQEFVGRPITSEELTDLEEIKENKEYEIYAQYKNDEERMINKFKERFNTVYKLRPEELNNILPLIEHIELSEDEILDIAREHANSYTCLRALADKGSKKLSDALQNHIDTINNSIERIAKSCNNAIYSNQTRPNSSYSARTFYESWVSDRINDVNDSYNNLMETLGIESVE